MKFYNTVWFDYHFVSVYYHLKEHYVNFSRFFKASLTTLYTHRIIEFSKALISNHFLLGLWIPKKKCQDVTLCKKVSAFWKNTIFPIAMQESTQDRKLTLKMCFWGSSATSILNFIYFFFFWKAETFLHKTCNFQIGIRTGSQCFFTIDGEICCKSVEIKWLFNFTCSYFTSVMFLTKIDSFPLIIDYFKKLHWILNKNLHLLLKNKSLWTFASTLKSTLDTPIFRGELHPLNGLHGTWKKIRVA